MLDVILDLLGGALFVGQAAYFLFFTGNWSVPTWSDRSMISSTGPNRAVTAEGSEMETHQL